MPKICCLLCGGKVRIANSIDSYTYYRCLRCEVLLLFPQPTKGQLDAYYVNSFNYGAGKANAHLIRDRAKKILQSLKDINPNGANLLDIGSGYGYLLEEAYKIGLNVTGVEPSCQLSGESINQVNKSIHHMTFEKFFQNNRKKKYDFITIVHVIEHVKDPRKMIQSACQLLTRNGILLIETPNLDSHLYHVQQNDYTFLTPPDHLWIFSNISILSMIPTQCVQQKLSTYSYPEHFMGIIKSKFKVKNKTNISNSLNSTNLTNLSHNKKSIHFIISKIKYFFFDRIVARLIYRLLNIEYHGSILELYIRKK